MAQNDSVCCASYLRKHTSYYFHLWYTCITWKYLQVLFYHFIKILISQVVSGVKGQKMVQSKKNFCLSRSMSETPYIIWFSQSPACFFFLFVCLFCFVFSNFVFQVVRLVKGKKMVQNVKTFKVMIYYSNFMTSTLLDIGPEAFSRRG